jgi:hypothetical protein
VEEITEKGVFVVRVPSGTYQLIAGARGFEIVSQPLVEITEKSGTSLAIVLPALKPVTGRLKDSEGGPVIGGRVATVNAAIPAPLGKLSELAVRHLASDWSVTADARGEWKLMVPQGTVPLLFEAPGSAAEWRTHSATDLTTLDVSLSRGATLTVTTDRVDPNLVVTLSREDAGRQSGILDDEQTRVWARWTSTNVLTWDSLPPGTYGVYAKYPAARYFMQSAVKLTTVKLGPGEHRQNLTLPPARRPVAKAAALFLWGVPPSDLAGDFVAYGRDAAGNPQRLEHFVEAVISGSVVHVKTDGVRPPLYATTGDRFFATVPDLADAVQEANAKPWLAAGHPRADAQFSLRFVEEDLQPPQSGLAVLRDCNKIPRVTVPIEISNSIGQFTAAGGCQGMVLELEPFEPVIPNRALLPGDQSLGEYVLRGAGAADVRVVRDPSGAFVPGATVQAVSAETPGQRPVVVKETLTDDRGWASLSGLPSYWKLRLIAETPDGDTSDPAIVRIQPRERAVIDPLPVPEPAALIVDAKIDGAVLDRFPGTRVVAVHVSPADPERSSEKRQENTVHSTAPTRFDRLHPGRWLIMGVVRVAGVHSLFDIEDLELKAGEERRVEATVEPNVFEGIVTSNGKSVVAKVMIRDRDRTLYFNTDTDGVFRVVLQERGTYAVAVARLSAQGNTIPIGNVGFTDPTRRIEIALPETGSVTARVRRGERPVPGAIVWLSRRDDTGRVDRISGRGGTTNVAGETAFEDVTPGVWTFSVRGAEQRQGAEKTVTVEAGKKIVIDLELTSAAAIEGTIRDLGGSPLPRASVECLFKGPSGNADRARVDTDAEGAFAVDLIPPAPPSALCSVIGPMGTVDAFKAVPGQKINLSVSGARGVLQIADWPEYRDPDAAWLIAQDGRVISLRTVASKIGQFGSPLTIPGLAAGVWKVVRVDSLSQWLALVGGMGLSLPAVEQITLRGGATETIYLNGISPDR